MAQKLRDDKIGTLQHNAGNIQMLASVSNPAYLTIGGQQYKITTNLTQALPSMTANTRYQVFAVNNAGTIELRITTNENSVGPAGFNRWKLIGSLYSDANLAFGDFVNIKGVPRTSKLIYGGLCEFRATGAALAKANVLVDELKWERDGRYIRVSGNFKKNAGGTAGTGFYVLTLPWLVDGSLVRNEAIGAISLGDMLGTMHIAAGAGGEYEIGNIYGYNPGSPGANFDELFFAVFDTNGGEENPWNPSQNAFSNQNNVALTAKFPVVGLSDDAIEDL